MAAIEQRIPTDPAMVEEQQQSHDQQLPFSELLSLSSCIQHEIAGNLVAAALYCGAMLLLPLILTNNFQSTYVQLDYTSIILVSSVGVGL